MKPTWYRWLLLACGTALLLSALTACGSADDEEQIPQTPVRAMPVQEEPAAEGTLPLRDRSALMTQAAVSAGDEDYEIIEETISIVPETTAPAAPAATDPGTDAGDAWSCSYVLNTNSHKFHEPSCSSVGDMNPKNRSYFSGTRDEAIAQGYSPCGRCKP